MRIWIALALVSGCVIEQGSGVVVEETRTVAAFDVLDVDNGVVVQLDVDAELAEAVDLLVTADDNLLPHLTTEVRGDTLFVDVEANVHSRSDLRVEGTVPPLSGVHADNGSVVDVAPLAATALDTTVNNGAVMTLSGDAASVSLEVGNGAVFTGDDLTAGDMDVRIHNGGTASVCATGTVTGSVSGGAVLEVRCGGNTSGVQVSGGGVLD